MYKEAGLEEFSLRAPRHKLGNFKVESQMRIRQIHNG